jgi:uncharacterized membrane protein
LTLTLVRTGVVIYTCLQFVFIAWLGKHLWDKRKSLQKFREGFSTFTKQMSATLLAYFVVNIFMGFVNLFGLTAPTEPLSFSQKMVISYCALGA